MGGAGVCVCFRPVLLAVLEQQSWVWLSWSLMPPRAQAELSFSLCASQNRNNSLLVPFKVSTSNERCGISLSYMYVLVPTAMAAYRNVLPSSSLCSARLLSFISSEGWRYPTMSQPISSCRLFREAACLAPFPQNAYLCSTGY